MDAYMAVTVHYIDNKTWTRKSLVVACIPFKQNHTAANLALMLEGVLTDFGLLRKVHVVVRDNGINVVNALEQANFNHVGCFLHGLHLVVKNSISCQRAVCDLLAKVRNALSKM